MYREILSATLDGEAAPTEQRATEGHVATCAACATWADAASAVTRATRLSAADDVPDLTATILMASPAGPQAVGALPVARIGLALVALAQILIAIPALFDATGVAVHLSREQGVWEVALAIGFATAAWQPRRAPGMVPLVAALVVGLFVTGSIDAADGTVGLLSEGHHLVALVGLGLLVTSTRLSAAPHRLAIR